jgi:hypothetical protein
MEIRRLDDNSVIAEVPGGSFSGVDYSGLDLGGADLRGLDLSCSDFRRCHLEGSSLKGSRLVASYFNDAVLRETDLSDCDLSICHFSGARFDGANLNRADLSGANIIGINTPVSFRNATARNATFCNARILGVSFRGADLTRADFKGVWCGEAVEWPEGVSPESLGVVTYSTYRRAIQLPESPVLNALMRSHRLAHEARLAFIEACNEEGIVIDFASGRPFVENQLPSGKGGPRSELFRAFATVLRELMRMVGSQELGSPGSPQRRASGTSWGRNS